MNQRQRKELSGYREQIENIKTYVESMMDDEQQKLDNLEERGIYEGDKYDGISEAVDNLQSISDSLDEALSTFDELEC